MRAVVLFLLVACTPKSAPEPMKSPAPTISPSVTSETPSGVVHLIGRFDASGAFSYPGSAMIARFEGTGVSIDLETSGDDWFAVSIDDGPERALHPPRGRGVRVLASELSRGAHTVRVSKRTESFVGTAHFFGFVVLGGALTPSPFPFARRIELIGDSITCGYGNERLDPCGFRPEDENESAAWGAVAARELGAAHTAIAYSGRGVFRNSDGSTGGLAATYFLRTFPDQPAPPWDFSRYTPDAVIINLGTNDWAAGDPGPGFTAAYLDLLRLVRRTYPRAFLVATLGTMMGQAHLDQARPRVKRALEELGDARASFLDLGVQDPRDGIGCGQHPSRATHRKMGLMLAAHLKEKLSW